MDDEQFEELLEQSSLGSPGARQLRARAPREQVALTRRITDLRNQMVHGDHAQARAAAAALLQLLRDHGYKASAEGERPDERKAVESQPLDPRARLQMQTDLLRQMIAQGYLDVWDVDLAQFFTMTTDDAPQPRAANDKHSLPPAGGDELTCDDERPRVSDDHDA